MRSDDVTAAVTCPGPEAGLRAFMRESPALPAQGLPSQGLRGQRGGVAARMPVDGLTAHDAPQHLRALFQGLTAVLTRPRPRSFRHRVPSAPGDPRPGWTLIEVVGLSRALVHNPGQVAAPTTGARATPHGASPVTRALSLSGFCLVPAASVRGRLLCGITWPHPLHDRPCDSLVVNGSSVASSEPRVGSQHRHKL
jgi:hypothetical protein